MSNHHSSAQRVSGVALFAILVVLVLVFVSSLLGFVLETAHQVGTAAGTASP